MSVGSVGELFIDLGIKGSEKTIGALGNTQKGLEKAGSMALETKAAILAAVYAFGRLVEASGAVGTGLTNFNALTGISVKTLQQYQYAARQVGVSNEDMAASFKSLQAIATEQRMTGNSGGMWGMLAAKTAGGAIGRDDIVKYSQNPELLFKRLQEFANNKSVDIGIRNKVLKSFGQSEDMTAGLERNAFRPEVLSKAPTYGENEVKALDRANIAWSNLGTKVEMAFGHFNAAHGGQIVKDISIITDKVVRLAEELVKLSEKVKLFEVLGKIFEGWSLIFGLAGQGVDSIGKTIEEKQKAFQKGDGGGIMDLIKGFVQGAPVQPAINDVKAPINLTLSQTFNGPTDPAKAGAAAKQGMTDGLLKAGRTNPTQGRQ